MSEKRICPICENGIPEDAGFLCPYCHFELKWMDDEKKIEAARKNFTGIKTSPPKELEPSEPAKPFPYRYHLIVGFLGGSLPWIVPGVYSFVEYGERDLGWILWTYNVFGIPIGLVTGLVVGFFTYRFEKKNGKPLDRPFVFLFRSFIISFFLSSPIFFMYWMIDVF